MIKGLKNFYLNLRKNIHVQKSNKYLNYYKDSYSVDLLKARQDYIKTGDITTLLRTLINNEVELDFRLFDDVPKKGGGRVLVAYNEFDKVVEYTYLLFKHTEYRNAIVLWDVSKQEMNDINDCDLIIPIMNDEDLRYFLYRLSECYRNYLSNIYIPKRRVMNGECGVQYLDIFIPTDNEVIVNAGCLDCKTDIEMIKWGKGKVKKIYALEPDPYNAEMCRRVIRENGVEEIVTLVEKGAWFEKSSMKISSNPNAVGSGVIGENGTSVEVDKIDNIVGNADVTFIKMDIEGAELPALKGARKTIKTNRPKLAICIYHKDSDIWAIPKYILSIVPEYRFYIRHYNSNEWETVLYAVCE